MKAGRYVRWAKARKRVAWIASHLESGRTVQITTYTKATRISAKSKIEFKANKAGAWMKKGKSWECIDGVHISAY